MLDERLGDRSPRGGEGGERLKDDLLEFVRRYAARYRKDRSEGAVRGEVSQLRTVFREAARRGEGNTLREVLADPTMLAAVLTSPSKQPSGTTALIRLGAINAALLVLFGPEEGRPRHRRRERGLEDGGDRGGHHRRRGRRG